MTAAANGVALAAIFFKFAVCAPFTDTREVMASKKQEMDCYEGIQSWMTTKKTEISAQHEFLKPIYLCVHRGIVLIYLDVHQKC